MPSSQFACLNFVKKPSGDWPRGRHFIGVATFEVPSGDVHDVAIYMLSNGEVLCDVATGAKELFSPGGAWRELHEGLLAALKDFAPELFVTDEPT